MAHDEVFAPGTVTRDPSACPGPLFPKSTSFRSNSTASIPQRRNWADLNDDSSDDQVYTPSSSSLPPASQSSLPKRMGLDLSDEPTGAQSSTSHDAASERSSSKGWHGSREASLLYPYEASSVESTPHLLMRSPVQHGTSRNISVAVPLLPPQVLTPAADARFWAEVASATATSSGSERPLEHARPPAWSVGAAEHESGNCHPCIFFPKAVGCDNGAQCTFCHLDHGSQARHRRHLRRGHGRRTNGDSDYRDHTGDSESSTTRQSRRRNQASRQMDVPEGSRIFIEEEEETAFMLPSALAEAEIPRRSNRAQTQQTGSGYTTSRVLGPALRPLNPSDESSASIYAPPTAGAEGGPSDRNTEVSVFGSLFAPLFGSDAADHPHGSVQQAPSAQSNADGSGGRRRRRR